MSYNFKLKELRTIKGISQQELADMLGIRQEQISRYESGVQEPTLDKLVKLAQALELTLDELVVYEKAHTEYSNELSEIRDSIREKKSR